MANPNVLSGATILITGGCTDLTLGIACELMKKEARVIVAAPDMKNAETAIGRLSQLVPNPKHPPIIKILKESKTSIDAYVAARSQSELPLDLVMSSTGVVIAPLLIPPPIPVLFKSRCVASANWKDDDDSHPVGTRYE